MSSPRQLSEVGRPTSASDDGAAPGKTGAGATPVGGSALADRARSETALAAAENRRAERLSWLRIGIFLIGVLIAITGLAATDAGATLFAVALVGVALLFTATARAQRRAERMRGWHRAIAAVCTEAIERRERAWAKLPLTATPTVESGHPYSADLGVASGRASLLQLLGPLGATTGARTVANWLLTPAPVTVIGDRQAAVAELAGHGEFRLELAARARLASSGRASDLAHFMEWAPGSPWLARRPLLATMRWVLPALWLATILAVTVQLLPAAAYMVPILVGIAVGAGGGYASTRLIARAAPGASTFRVFGEQFERIVREPCDARLLRELQASLIDDGVPASMELHRLRRLLDAAELRYSPMLHGVVNIVLGWDLHILAGLEQWQKRVGHRVAGWFDALGETEALTAFASLLADHDGWSLPEVVEDGDLFEAEALGHPLLPPQRCVRNDVVVGPPGSFLLVTGSNMAGKSTLLRGIGANTVLAMAGGPVCARRLRLPRLLLHTSMRVSDDLEAGLSFFMAELVRLSGVVRAARDASESGNAPRVLYLLDEILQGTNSAERQVAARRVMDHLLEAGAIGAVSTHDLTLADTPALRDAARPVHFREQFVPGGDGPRMTFDYLLRDGPATSANAMKLVELMGL